MIAAHGARSLDRAELMLTAISTGASDASAARLAGIDPSTLERWRQDDPSFDVLLCKARLEFAVRKLEELDAAGERDWKASAYALERLDETRDQFGAAGSVGNRPTAAIQVIVNVPRPEPLQAGASTVEATVVRIRDEDSRARLDP
jgi:hypothetical protein